MAVETDAGLALLQNLEKLLMHASEKIHFKPLNESHFDLILRWFNLPHVQAFYSLRSWTIEEVRNKLMPYLHGEKQIQGYVIYHEKRPIGYIQSCPIKEHPWDNQDLPDKIIQGSAGFDLFIGEKNCFGKGLGMQIVSGFLEGYIWPHYQYCLVDPDIRNEASIRLFRKCGFIEHKQIEYINALQQPVTLQLFIKERI